MKGKITIVLFSLALVFGMIAASCDNGDFPDGDTKDVSTLIVYKDQGDNLPAIDLDSDPVRYKAADLKPLLVEKTNIGTTATPNYVPKYAIATVAYNSTKHGNADSTKAKIAAKYAGLKILVVIER